jgi:hypothetical protein
MATPETFPLDDGQAGAFDELSGAMPALLNLLAEGPPTRRPRALRARPGLRTLEGFPASPASTLPVVQMCVLGGNLIYVTDDGTGNGQRKVFAWRADSDGTVVDLSAAGGDTLINGMAPVTLIAGRNYAYAAGGQSIQQISSGLVSSRLGGNPPASLDVALIAQRLVSARVDRSGILDWSGPGEPNHGTWGIFDFAEAESRPDPLVGIKEGTRELWAFGATTTQVFLPDEDAVFTSGPTFERGCMTKRSIIRVASQMAWLDHDQSLVLGGETVLSDAGIADTIRGLGTDVWGFRCTVGNHDLLCWLWESQGRGFAWDMVSQTWSEFRGWSRGRWVPWQPRSYLWWPERRLRLVGLEDGTIAELTPDAHADMTEALRWQLRTGFREVGAKRHAVSFFLPVRRGEAASDDSQLEVTWRDDLGPFQDAIGCPLGTAGDTSPEVEISPMGEPYARRQLQVTGAAAEAYRIMPAREVFEEAEF